MERTDQVADGSYGELVKAGGLSVDAGLAVPSVERLLSRIWSWEPVALISDPYRSAELNQVVAGRTRVIERARSGGEATSNVQALRSLLLDKPSGVTEPSRDLLAAAFAQTDLVIDSAGLTRMKSAITGEAETMLRRLCCWPLASWRGVLLRSICAGR